MRKWIDLILKFYWGMFLVLTSLYALLASLPYTYYALIKAPAYSWMPWFVQHHAFLYGTALISIALAYRQFANWRTFLLAWGVLGVAGFFLLVELPLATLQGNVTAYWYSVITLWPIVLVAALGVWKESAAVPESTRSVSHFSYSTAMLLSAGIALVYAGATRLQSYTATHIMKFTVKDIYLTIWSIFSHFIVLILLISVLNLVRIAAARAAHPRAWRWRLSTLLVFGLLWVICARFLQSAFTFEGWQVHLYAASLSAALSFLGLSIAAPFLLSPPAESAQKFGRSILLPALVSISVALAVLALHAFIGGADWNGFIQGTFALVFWIVVGFCVYRMQRQSPRYKLSLVLLAIISAILSYEDLQASEILWAKPLGKTDDEIQQCFEKYAASDVSFNLVHHLLGNGRSEPCEEACRIMRAYTNVPNVKMTFDLKLVDSLVRVKGERPNIYFIVVDSMRPDYLGAYNSKVDFTPNLDAFAKENIALRNVYTPYAGTSLSEPAMWTGALLLHTHYVQPFSRVNSLEKLVRTDGYQIVLSQDEILKVTVPPSKDVLRLDTDMQFWNQLEINSTLSQLETVLQNRPSDSAPIFFYSQPKNVHQLARNKLPTPMASGWSARPGFSYRISFEVHQVDEFLGKFFSWLKAHDQYENSIIIITSDHGDATGEFGRISHSLVIYPEIMRVPLLIHLPSAMRRNLVYDDSRVSSLIDITPSLYYLLGHRPIVSHPLFGRPLFATTLDELHSYGRDDLFFASDVRAAYGILAGNGRYFYATYDSPAQSYLFDLANDPNGEHNILTGALKRQYDQEVIDRLHAIGDFYGYKPGLSSLAVASRTTP